MKWNNYSTYLCSKLCLSYIDHFSNPLTVPDTTIGNVFIRITLNGNNNNYTLFVVKSTTIHKQWVELDVVYMDSNGYHFTMNDHILISFVISEKCNLYNNYDKITFGTGSGSINQSIYSMAIGVNAGNTNQSINSIAFGYQAGYDNQGEYSIAEGNHAAESQQGKRSMAFGNYAGQLNQGDDSLAMGNSAGLDNQGLKSLAIGNHSGQTYQGEEGVAIGHDSGSTRQGPKSVAIGPFAGHLNQSTESTAIGNCSGKIHQGLGCNSIGSYAGHTHQGDYGIAYGYKAGYVDQSPFAMAFGYEAGNLSQGNSSMAFGNRAGYKNQGDNSMAFGNEAGYTYQHNNTLILNASGQALDSITPYSTYIKPIRMNNSGCILVYDEKTGEIMNSNISINDISSCKKICPITEESFIKGVGKILIGLCETTITLPYVVGDDAVVCVSIIGTPSCLISSSQIKYDTFKVYIDRSFDKIVMFNWIVCL